MDEAGSLKLDEAIQRLEHEISSGRDGKARMEVEDGPVIEGSYAEVLIKLQALKTDLLRRMLRELRNKLDKVAGVLDTDKGRFVFEHTGILWDDLMTEVANAKERVQPFPELQPEMHEIQQSLDRLASSLRAPVEAFGTGKVESLKEYRLARDADQVRLPPMRDLVEQYVKAFGGGLTLPQIMEKLMSQGPYADLFRRCYPKIYENTGQYHSPRQCSAFLANVIAETLRYGYHRSPTAYRLLLPALSYMMRHGMPMFFIAPDLLKAVQMTDFDDDINWSELKLPFESGVFVLPKGGLLHPEDGEVSMIVWSRIRPGEVKSPWPGIPTLTMDNTSFSIVALCPEQAVWFDSTLSADFRPTLRLRNLFYRGPGEPMPEQMKSVPWLDADLTEKDSEFLEKIGVIVFGTLMVMNARPNLVGWHRLLKRVGRGDKVREFWSPNIIGERYRMAREIPRVVDGQFVTTHEQHGTHASPRMHWRRGHHRMQAIGKGRRERKQIWIEPILVNAEVA